MQLVEKPSLTALGERRVSDRKATKTDGVPVRFPVLRHAQAKVSAPRLIISYFLQGSGSEHDPDFLGSSRLMLFFLGFFQGQALESRDEILLAPRHERKPGGFVRRVERCYDRR
jgi:hypothetical protein